MRDTIVFLLGTWLIFLPYSWAARSLSAYEPDKVNVIACQRASPQVIQCQHDRVGFLWQPATKTQFQLRQAKVVAYQDSCGENSTCDYWLLSLVTDGETIEIKDFGSDGDRANLLQARFDALLHHPSDRVGAQMRYGNSWYTIFLQALLLVATGILWLMLVPWLERLAQPGDRR